MIDLNGMINGIVGLAIGIIFGIVIVFCVSFISSPEDIIRIHKTDLCIDCHIEGNK
jgi:ABC-type lipoprotein release transport system permease subunit